MKMVTFIHKLVNCDFAALCAVYAQSLESDRARDYPLLDAREGALLAEQDFYQYLSQVFFKTPGAVLLVYSVQGIYVSALRLEPYKDGFVLSALETCPEYRRNGFALSLVHSAVTFCDQNGIHKLYAHIQKKNIASEKLHLSAGFALLGDGATLLDGAYSSQYTTYCYTNQGDK